MATKSMVVRTPQNLNLQQCEKVLAAVLNKAGHPQCFSGFKIGFQDIVDPPEILLTVDAHGKVAGAQV